MGCAASKHLGRHSSMEGCSSVPGNVRACNTEFSVEYHKHVFALVSSSNGQSKPSDPKESKVSEKKKVGTLDEMYRRLISLEMDSSADLQPLQSALGSSQSSEALSTPANHSSARGATFSTLNEHQWNINSAELVISKIINVKELMMGFEETANHGGCGPGDNSSAMTETYPAQRGMPVLRRSKKIFQRPLHTVEEVDLVKKSGKANQHGLDEEGYESGKENAGSHCDHPNLCNRHSVQSSCLSHIVQPLKMARDAQVTPLATKPIPQNSVLPLNTKENRKAAIKHKRTDPAEGTPLQTRKIAASDRSLSISVSRRIAVHKNSFSVDNESSPFFDPKLVASYERALTNISEESWNACFVDSPEVESKRAASPVSHNEQQLAIAGHHNLIVSKGEDVTLNLLDHFPLKCPPGGSETVVLYTTTLRGIKKTFEDCNIMRELLQGYGLNVDERDVSMHLGFLNELRGLMDRVLAVPRLFIKGRYIGGIEEVGKLHEDCKLKILVEGLPRAIGSGNCEGCDGIRFVPCLECRGSCKIRCEDRKVIRCPDCNENGLIQCPICT